MSVGDCKKRCTLCWWFTGIRYNYTIKLHYNYLLMLLNSSPALLCTPLKENTPKHVLFKWATKGQRLVPIHQDSDMHSCDRNPMIFWNLQNGLIPSKSWKTFAAPWLSRSRGGKHLMVMETGPQWNKAASGLVLRLLKWWWTWRQRHRNFLLRRCYLYHRCLPYLSSPYSRLLHTTLLQKFSPSQKDVDMFSRG